MVDDIVCSLAHVSKSFTLPSRVAFTVFEDISLDIRADEILALLGPSGCGKSTLLRIVAGLLRADAGDVRYRDQPLEGINPGVAFVFQSFALYPWLTVEQNISVDLM